MSRASATTRFPRAVRTARLARAFFGSGAELEKSAVHQLLNRLVRRLAGNPHATRQLARPGSVAVEVREHAAMCASHVRPAGGNEAGQQAFLQPPGRTKRQVDERVGTCQVT